jgi:hypothetical protein
MNALPLPDDGSANDLSARSTRSTRAPTVAIGRRDHARSLRPLGHPPGEIAALLGLTAEAIRTWVTRARAQALDRRAPRRSAGLGGCRTDAAKKVRRRMRQARTGR